MQFLSTASQFLAFAITCSITFSRMSTTEVQVGERRFDVLDPSDGSVITSLPSATVDDGIAAVDAAHAAAGDWASRAPRERAEILRRGFDLMTARAR